MCSLFGLIDFKGVLNTHMKNKILNTLARECQVRGTDATGIAYNFNDRLRIYKRPIRLYPEFCVNSALDVKRSKIFTRRHCNSRPPL